MGRCKTLLAIAALAWTAVSNAAPRVFDLEIMGGTIVDGTGNPWYKGDIGIKGNQIVAIGDLRGRSAAREIDARGKVVAPGFIDMMGGSSLPLLEDPVSAESKLRQGITTMMAGEGESMAPQNARTIKILEEETGVRATWKTYREYMSLLQNRGVALNVMHNVGAAQVREYVMGSTDRPPTAGELKQMKELIAQAMADGAVGLSTALIYPPDAYTDTNDLIQLAKVVAKYRGVYFTHVRNESGHLLDALDEAIRIGREAGVPVHIYHLKAAGARNWDLVGRALTRIEEARKGGVDVTADIYPYKHNGLNLTDFIPPKRFAGGMQAFVKSLSDPLVRRDIRRELEYKTDWENWYLSVGSDWNNVLISEMGPNGNRALNGLSVQQAAMRDGRDVWSEFFALIRQGNPFVSVLSMNEQQKRAILNAPFVSICTDGPPIDPVGAKGSPTESFSPRAFGAFARIIERYVREEHVISLEDAIREMTSLPAEILQLQDRGHIGTGMKADIVVFDPRAVRETGTYAKPLSYAVGFEYVLVNGTLVIDDGRWTGALPGSIIRHGPCGDLPHC